ncbi:hypothetical protein C2E23DRAFT_255855 [Lenzites betulinus]|nr:hypothetical protein C2E23DRAFT_255855 [Lenzites betulinus]
MFASAAILFLAASPALANLFMTSPVASTDWTAGQQVTITWQDDGQSPSLAELGNCSVGLFVGGVTQQVCNIYSTQIQQVVASVNVASTSSIVFTPDASAGANSAGYFIRFESLTAKDATNSAFPAEAFSAKFQLNGMTGSFSAAVQAQIDGASSASAAASAAPSTSASATSLASTSKAASTSSHAPSSSASATANNNGAASLAGSAAACIAGVAVTFAMLF